MIERFTKLPSALEKQTKMVRLGERDVPALVAHPDWERPAPIVLWMHGRTVDKSLDPGRYLRWIRHGIAACAVDLPGHGERAIPEMQSPDQTLYVVKQMVEEIDSIVAALGSSEFEGVFDLKRIGIGGMSAGGMATLRRLCEPHTFACAAVESTIGDCSVMPYEERYPRALIDELDPIQHVSGWRPIPLLALHSEKDEWAPVEGMRRFVGKLRERYAADATTGETPVPLGRDISTTFETPVPPPSDDSSVDSMIQFITWPSTGAPHEHAGFGRVANDAKNLQLAFFQRWLKPGEATA